jgi:hypothetical protein
LEIRNLALPAMAVARKLVVGLMGGDRSVEGGVFHPDSPRV